MSNTSQVGCGRAADEPVTLKDLTKWRAPEVADTLAGPTKR